MVNHCGWQVLRLHLIDAISVGQNGTFGALLAAIYRRSINDFTATGRFDDTLINAYIIEYQPHDSVVVFQTDLFQGRKDSSGNPFVTGASDRSR